MKDKASKSTVIGVLIYVVYSLVDRFWVRFPDVVAIPALILGTVLILAGMMKPPKDNR
ncbi:MAG: hypothetical protein PHS80_14650 [Methanothrix sp.]|jgi:hypothetical protein|nr:hypothetical protein [Methanothrix sp.]